MYNKVIGTFILTESKTKKLLNCVKGILVLCLEHFRSTEQCKDPYSRRQGRNGGKVGQGISIQSSSQILYHMMVSNSRCTCPQNHYKIQMLSLILPECPYTQSALAVLVDPYVVTKGVHSSRLEESVTLEWAMIM